MDWGLQKQLFIGFLRSGLLGYGGGPSAIPLVHREVVDNYKWLSNDEFSDILALGNTLPGPIATKMAGYIGYRLGGITGMLVALIATVLPTVLGMIALVGLLTTFKESPIVEGMTRAVTPVIAVMLAVMTWQFITQSRKELGWIGVIVLFGASLLLYGWLGIHPAILIGVLLVAALVGNPLRGRSRP
jgi:chromate transporter